MTGPGRLGVGRRWHAEDVPGDPPPPLDPCEPSPGLTEFLLSLGATPEQIEEATARSGLVGLGADLVFAPREGLTATDLADRAGIPVSQVLDIWQALGVPVPGDDTPMFSAADVALVRTLGSVDIFSGNEGDELLHVVGNALSKVADAAISVYVANVESALTDSGADTLYLAQRSASAARLALDLGAGLGAVFTHLLRDGVERQRLAQANVTDRALFRLSVGFVDLVGFTPLSHRLRTRELSTFIGQFENRAFQLAGTYGGRIVKHIGDEVMFVALDARAGCELALALIAEFVDEGVQPRGGLAFGDVVARQGDYYGEVVNLASRLADLAIPGELLADDGTREAASSSGLVFEAAGRRQLKGFDEPVTVYSVRRPLSPA